MINRTLTSLALRFAGLLLFLKIFDHFGSYFLSLYMTSVIPIFEEQLNEPMNKFYFNGTFLMIANVIVSFFLVFKAELISKWLIKNDSEISIQLTKEDFIKSILVIIGVIWIAKSVYLLPDGIEYVIQLTRKLSGNENINVPDFSVPAYLIKTGLGLLFIFRVNKISNYLNKKTEKTTVQQGI